MSKSIPKMPVFKKPDKHQTKAALQRQIRQLIVKLRDILPKGDHGEMIIRFLGVIHPGKAIDVTRLPFGTENGTTKQETKVACLYAKISYLILCYWNYCFDKADNVTPVKQVLSELEEVVAYGLSNYRVGGDVKNGFKLEMLKRGEK